MSQLSFSVPSSVNQDLAVWHTRNLWRAIAWGHHSSNEVIAVSVAVMPGNPNAANLWAFQTPRMRKVTWCSWIAGSHPKPIYIHWKLWPVIERALGWKMRVPGLPTFIRWMDVEICFLWFFFPSPALKDRSTPPFVKLIKSCGTQFRHLYLVSIHSPCVTEPLKECALS